MKVILLLLLISTVLLVQVACQDGGVLMTQTREVMPMNNAIFDICWTCVTFFKAIDTQVFNVILNIGVVGSCSELCNYVQVDSTGTPRHFICNIMCNMVGVQDFVRYVVKADLNAIYYCELAKACPVFDGGDAHITHLSVTPQSGPPGKRTIDYTYESQKGTGTGQVNIVIQTRDGIPVGSSFLNEKQGAGSHQGSIELDAEQSPDCHPNKRKCETWKKGEYTLVLSVCNGQCRSDSPHSHVYDHNTVNFTLT